MHIHVTNDYTTLSQRGADIITEAVAAKPDIAVVLATGETPMGVYRELAERRQRGEIDTSRLRIFQLDAYLGIAEEDPRSLYGWMKRSVLDPLGILDTNVMRLPGDTPDPLAVCRAYDAAVQAAGGFDLSVLGLGPNGHLGFNEPLSAPDTPTRIVTLTEASLASNARYWDARAEVPREALTCGMAQLLSARQTLLLVSGEHKRDILRRAVAGPITPEVPASYLQIASAVTVVADKAAWPTPMKDTTYAQG